MPNIRLQNLGASLKVLYVDNTDLVRDKRSTLLTDDVVATGTTIRVQSIIGFESLTTSSGQVLCIGKIGDERTEIIKTSSTSALSSTYKEVALNSGLIFDHPQDTPIYIVDWDRVEFRYSGTASGTKSTLLAYPINIEADRLETSLNEGTKDQVFYFARFNNTVDNRYSDYSDPLYSGGYDDNSVFQIKKSALDSLGMSVDGKLITHEFLNSALWEARREYHQATGKRPFRRKYNTIIGTVLTGSYRIDLPSDVERPHTSENIYGVRIGTDENMDLIDKKEWDFYYEGIAHSTLDLPYTKGTSTSIWLTNGRDFSASATINVEGTEIGLTRITGEQNSFYIVTHGDWSASGGSDAWENASFGMPDKFTVFGDPGGSAYIYFNRPIDTAYINQNIYLDYYRTLVGYNSDADILDEPKYDMYHNYLKAKIKDRKSLGEKDILNDSDYKLWIFKKNDALSSEVLDADINLVPGIDHLPIPE